MESSSSSSTVIWSDHSALLVNSLMNLYAEGRHSDLTIKCHDRQFHVHKLVLQLFTSHFSEADGLWVRIEMDPGILEKVLLFMYGGQVSLAQEDTTGFLQACKQLKLKLFKGDSLPEHPLLSNVEVETFQLNDFQLICKNCYRTYESKKALDRHVWGCTHPRDRKCRFCDRTFRFKNDVENHERFHTGDKPFVCEVCDKAFTLKCTLVDHVRSVHEKLG